MTITFFGFGHQNISAKHLTTIEFTTAQDVSPRGDCIISCKVQFDLKELQKLLTAARLKITIKADDVSDVVECIPNPAFNDSNEIVIRMSGVKTTRTLGINADKGAGMLKRELASKLKNPEQKIVIVIEEVFFVR